MKAVIALSGLAGFALFGPGLHSSHTTSVHHKVVVDTHEVTRVVSYSQDRCKYEDELSLTMPTGAGDALRLVAGSGSLEVTGVAGLREVRAVGRACASHQEFLEELDLTGETRDSELFLETHYPDFSGMRGWGNRYARIDLRIEVPEGMEAAIRDSSGGMVVQGLGPLSIEDGSGEIEVFDVDGTVRIDDRSGEIIMQDVTGDVEIEDGSGEIELRGMGGNVTLEDSSGEINVEDVEGTVRVTRDGSGSIEVDGIGGDFVVERDGSGRIRYDNVRGKVDIPRRRR